MKVGFLFFLVISFMDISSYAQRQPEGIAYGLNLHIEGPEDNLSIEPETYISYRGYLFEFRIRGSFHGVTSPAGHVTYSRFDTVGLFLLDLTTRRCYEFDTMSMAAQLMWKGKFSEKKVGVVLRDTVTRFDFREFQPEKLRDTLLFKRKFSYFTYRTAINGSPTDVFVLVIKSPAFISPYSINAEIKNHKEYKIICQDAKTVGSNESGGHRLGFFRPITPEEQKICDRLIELVKVGKVTEPLKGN